MINAIKKSADKFGVGLAAFVAWGAANAALPTEVTGAFTAMEGHVTDLQGPAWALLVSVVGGFVLMKLFKKFVNRAS